MKKFFYSLYIILIPTLFSCGFTIYEIDSEDIEKNYPITDSSLRSNLFENLFVKKLDRHWKVYLIHHTHLDIGYTHTQDEVLQIQFKHLEKAMDLIESNKNRPIGARFKWNPEITWAVYEWMQKAPKEKLERFVNHVQDGYIGLDGLYANLLTGLCRPEEIMASFSFKKKLEDLTDRSIDSAMITDIPGWNWGFVTALAENRIKYLSIGTNTFDRIGHIKNDWGDIPFYWESPSSKEKILAFIHAKGYSWFHTGMNAKENLSKKLTPARISGYLKELEKSNYPYNITIIRYNIGADNGPPDHTLSGIIEKWNTKYPKMQMKISTTSEAMSDFEAAYKNQIPTFKGDLTPYWEDGAASTARETAIVREASERLNQAASLNAMTNKNSNTDTYESAWKDVLLFNEHTWGAHNSISKPDDPFAKSQWAWKKERAYDGLYKSYNLLKNSTENTVLFPLSYVDIIENQNYRSITDEITVYNTHSWPMTQVVKVYSDKNEVVDESGNIIQSQRLSDGSLAFIAKDVPPTGSNVYLLRVNNDIIEDNTFNNSHTLENKFISIKINSNDGKIDSILYKNKELVKASKTEKFNQYIFATGKWGMVRKLHKPSYVEITKLDNGPIVYKIQIKSDAFRTNQLITTISLTSINEYIHINNIVDRPVSRKKEGVHFEFPFNLKNGRVKYDTIFGSAVVDRDQMKGANKNFITATRWVDISDNEFGVSCALLDAPIFKSGPITRDPLRMGNPYLCGWKTKTNYNGTIYSYIMNNYWMTNYKADQPGKTLFRYVFKPHRIYSEADTHRFAIEQAQPLVVLNTSEKLEPLVVLSNPDIIVTSIKKSNGLLFLRFMNISNRTAESSIEVMDAKKYSILSPDKSSLLADGILRLSTNETILIGVE